MKQLSRRLPGVRFLVACYKAEQRDCCRRMLAERASELDASLCVGKTSEIIELGEVCLMVSGSVSLEVLARETPAVVMYRMNRAFFWLCKMMVTCKYLSLPNLIADRPVMPEFVAVDDPRPAITAMTGVLHRWLTDPATYARQKDDLSRLRDEVATAGATANAARAILERLGVTDAESARAA
jgi:lipid-A-disaccharide synthase